MTADMRGIVETVEPAYENTRMAIRLEGNSTRYTIMLRTTPPPDADAPGRRRGGDQI